MVLEKVLESVEDVKRLKEEDKIRVVSASAVGNDRTSYDAVVIMNNPQSVTRTLTWVYRDETGLAVQQHSDYASLKFEHGAIVLSQNTRVKLPGTGRESQRVYHLLEGANL